MKVGAPVDAKGLVSKFHGGLTIADVIANGEAAKAGFRKGDILVGLHRYETLSLNDVVFVLRNLEAPAKGSTSQSVRAHIVRDGETLYGDLVLPVPAQNAEKKMSVEELIYAMNNDRDAKHVNLVLNQLGRLNLGGDAEQITAAILAAMEFHDPTVAPPYHGNVPPSFFAIETLKVLPRSAKVPALVKALRDGHPRVKRVAIQSIVNDSST